MTRYPRSEMAKYRADVRLMFNEPSDQQMRELMATFERIHGRIPSTGQHNYLIRCFRIHGKETCGLMERLYAERGSTENLLLAVEIHPRSLPVQPTDTTRGEPSMTVL